MDKFKEFREHKKVCDYLRINYPTVFFFSDIAGENLSFTARRKVYSLRSSDGVPDLFIFKRNKNWSSLILEVKDINTEIVKMDGDWVNDHVSKQAKVLEYLIDEKFFACFVIGHKAAIDIIEKYMRNEI